MIGKRKIIFGLVILLLLGTVGGYFTWPRLILAAHDRFPAAVPDGLLYLVATPLPTALPAPTSETTSGQLAIISSQLAELQPGGTDLPPTPLPPTFTPPAADTDALPAVATSTPSATLLPPSPTPLPTAVRLENIEIIPQKFNNCGPANLTITMGYFGHSVDQLDVGDVLKPNYDDRNVSPWELVSYVNTNTPLKARYFVGGEIELLMQLVAAGYPVIIEKGLYPNAWEGWMGHYLTVVGYDDASQVFISLDTFLGPWDSSGRQDSFDTIEAFWQQFNHTFILIYPPEDEAGILSILPPSMLEPQAMWQAAAVKNQQVTHQEPENPFAWFNLGSSLTHLARLTEDATLYASAAAAFDQARTIGLPWRMLWYQFEPYEAYLANGRIADVFTLSEAILSTEGGQNVEETYLYRSQAFMAQGDVAAANAAMTRAQELNPNQLLQPSDE